MLELKIGGKAGMIMRNTWKKFRIGAIAVSSVMLALGILMILWPDISALTVCVILGAFCITAGIYAMVRYLKLGLAGVFFRFDLTFGICSILSGTVLLFHPYKAAVLLPMAAGFFLVIGSAVDIQVAVEMRRFHIGNWGVAIVLGMASTALAFLLLLNPFKGAAILMVLIGVSLVTGGIQNLYSIYCVSKAVKGGKNDGIIDADWYSID